MGPSGGRFFVETLQGGSSIWIKLRFGERTEGRWYYREERHHERTTWVNSGGGWAGGSAFILVNGECLDDT